MDHPNTYQALPLPPHYDPQKVGQVWAVPYQARAAQAQEWARQHAIPPAAGDAYRVALIAIDLQNTFCIPGFELFVGGRSGSGAVDDNRRLCQFIYRSLGALTHITATLDTHSAMQIFHPIFLVDAHGRSPEPLTLVSYTDLLEGKWRFNPAVAPSLGITPEYGQQHLEHYAEELKQRGKYDLTVWPYHVMLGSIGHALAPAVEEAIFFHTVARASQADFTIKGGNPLTEHYSAIGPEVLDGPFGEPVAERSGKFIQRLQ
ncbi:MAG: isochorismatase, partial [Chloroflexota bacterium]